MMRTGRVVQTTGSRGTYTSTAHPLPPPVQHADTARSKRWDEGAAEYDEEITKKRSQRHRFLITPSGVCGDCMLERDATIVLRLRRNGYVPRKMPIHTGDKT